MKHKDSLKIFALFSIMAVLYLYLALPSAFSWGPLNNYRNFSVRTTVNITDAMPEILNITCNGGSAIALSPGSVQNITCIVEIRDFNGGNTLNGTVDTGAGPSRVNISYIYYYLNSSNQPDDNNSHYTNNTCTLTGPANGYYVNWTCGFHLWYYANNGTWTVNVTAHDRYNNRSYNVSGYKNVTVSPLYAFNVTNTIDFGNMYVGEASQNAVQANVTNFGNMNINVSVYGYGAENQALYSSLALLCEVRNLTLTNERYSLSSSPAWASMTAITATAVQIPNLTVIQRQDENLEVVNSTYWRLYVDPASNPFGQCNGTVIFSAIAAN